ncbi:MAG TPA: SufD family Fe-S cluster assembly protein [Methylovirgula sp.]|nr:SufD family Fe-S cluster assembly protein [Methylovirgula sp.]
MTAQVIPSRTNAEVALAEAFASEKAKLPGDDRVARLREEAFAAFARAGLPHRRIESWHYTDLRALMRDALPVVSAPSEAQRRSLLKDTGSLPTQSLVLVDGVFAPELSAPLPDGVKVTPLAGALAHGEPKLIESLIASWAEADDAVLALNAALMQDGIVIDVAPGAKIAAPIHLVYASVANTPSARFSRSLVRIGAGADVRINEMSLGAGGRVGQTNNVLIFEIGDEAQVGHTAALTDTRPGSMRLETFMVKIGAGAEFDSFALITGEGLVRRQIFKLYEGPDAKASLRGVSLLRGREHADTTLFVRHAATGCEGRQTFRYILDEEATGIFQGKVIVSPGAQKTDGKMLAKALMLSEEATMNSRPELEIFADDVICGHGATCGGLNADQLFYLRSRGLMESEAEALLLEAFANELVDDIGHEDLVASYRAEIADWLARRVASRWSAA